MNLEPSHISDLNVTAIISSICSNDEDPLWQRALQKLTSTEAPLHWIDGSLHERFIDHSYEEVHTNHGECRKTLDQRDIEA
jgi:predicted secreted protein